MLHGVSDRARDGGEEEERELLAEEELGYTIYDLRFTSEGVRRGA
jgi:hypothetical protein